MANGNGSFGTGIKTSALAAVLATGLTGLIVIFSGVEPMTTTGLLASLGSLIAGTLGLVEWNDKRQARREKERADVARRLGRGLGAFWIACLLGLGAMAPTQGACGTAFGDVTGKAGMCIGRCALGCATTWVGDLLQLPATQEADPSELPRLGARLHYLVRDYDGTVYDVAGIMVSSPHIAGPSLRVGYMLPDGGGSAIAVMLAPEPRLYCASVEGFEGAQPAPPGFVPSDPPVSPEDFVERFGELPGW